MDRTDDPDVLLSLVKRFFGSDNVSSYPYKEDSPDLEFNNWRTTTQDECCGIPETMKEGVQNYLNSNGLTLDECINTYRRCVRM